VCTCPIQRTLACTFVGHRVLAPIPGRPPLPIEISTTAAPAGSGEGLFVFGVLHKVQRTSLSLRLVQLGVRGSTLGGTPHHPLTRLFARSGALQAE
jgi:hypothetical protein